MAKQAPLESDDASAGKQYTPPKPGSGIVVTKVKPVKDPKDKGIFTQEDLTQHGGTMKEPPRDVMPEDLKPIKKAKGGMTASARADGIAQRGKTRGKML